uniref:two component sensor kinase n=1 Tax=Chroothece richteriana TaxID=101928 RepID=UPI001FCCC1DE|nr:two component sensor kinase [Chroothece richteriana]UNJ14133.1 two component sensor kinase [Chroothece richteriana]
MESNCTEDFNNLEAKKNYIKEFVHRIPYGAIISTINLDVLLINRKALNLLNIQYNEKECIGESFFNLLDFPLRIQLIPIIDTLINSSVPLTKKVKIQNSLNLNKKLTLAITIDIWYGTFPCISFIIEENKHSNELELDQVYFNNYSLQNVSHELRSPLFNVQYLLDTLVEYNDSLSNNQKIEFLNIAKAEILRLTRLVHNLLDSPRINQQSPNSSEVVDLKLIALQVIELCHFTAKSKNINLILESCKSKNFCCVLGNRDPLFQVLYNLIDNAIKFNLFSGTVVIRVFRYSNYSNTTSKFFTPNNISHFIRTEISDTGIGINFQKKWLGSRVGININKNSHSIQTIGLGMSIVNNILQKYSSDIYCKSEPNVGTTFWFDLKAFPN